MTQVEHAIPYTEAEPIGTRPHVRGRLRAAAAKMDARRLARSLGWFSIGLGVAELLAPRKLGRAIGVGHHPVLLPLLGLREIASGVAILANGSSAAGVRSRVAGDVMDLGLLACALAARPGSRGRVTGAASMVLGVTAFDVLANQLLARQPRGAHWQDGAIHLTRSITINRGPDELYTFWRELENLPRALSHVQSVQVMDERRSHWVARLAGATTLEWDAEITFDAPDERLGWRSLEGSDLAHEGAVTFHALPGGRGTIVTVTIGVKAEGAALKTMEGLLGALPELMLGNDLRKLKQMMEAGEVATTEGQPSGRRSMISRHLP